MQPAAHANDNRPDWYDAKVTEYMPFIRKLANRAYRNGNADDLAQDVALMALRKWRSYRTEYKFGTWLVWVTRATVSDRKALATAKKRHALHVDLDRGVHIATQPTQDDYAELSATLARLSGRSGDVLLRIAMGDELGEIANDYGISRERVRQIGEQARTKLRRAVA